MTKGRTKWTHFLTDVPNLLPNSIVEPMEKAEKESRFEFEDDLGYVLGDVSRILADGARFLEDSVDSLLSITLLGGWTKMREKDPGMVASLEFEHGVPSPANHRMIPNSETAII